MRPYGLILRHTYSQGFFVGAPPPHPRKAVLVFNFSPFALVPRCIKDLSAKLEKVATISLSRGLWGGAPTKNDNNSFYDEGPLTFITSMPHNHVIVFIITSTINKRIEI